MNNLQKLICTGGAIISLPMAAVAENEKEKETPPSLTPELAPAIGTLSEGEMPTSDGRAAVETAQERTERLKNEVHERQENLKEMRSELQKAKDQAEMESKGNANHAKDLIEAETEVLEKKVEQLQDRIDTIKKKHLERAAEVKGNGKPFTYEAKMNLVSSFLAEANNAVNSFADSLSLKKPEDTVEAVKEGNKEKS